MISYYTIASKWVKEHMLCIRTGFGYEVGFKFGQLKLMSLPTYRTKCKDRARRRQEGGKAQFGCASLSINGGNLWRFRFVPCCAHLLSRV